LRAKIGTGYLSQKRRSENRDGLFVAKEEEGGLRNFEDFIVEAIENRDTKIGTGYLSHDRNG